MKWLVNSLLYLSLFFCWVTCTPAWAVWSQCQQELSSSTPATSNILKKLYLSGYHQKHFEVITHSDPDNKKAIIFIRYKGEVVGSVNLHPVSYSNRELRETHIRLSNNKFKNSGFGALLYMAAAYLSRHEKQKLVSSTGASQQARSVLRQLEKYGLTEYNKFYYPHTELDDQETRWEFYPIQLQYIDSHAHKFLSHRMSIKLKKIDHYYGDPDNIYSDL